MTDWLQIAGGALLLYLGAEWLVGGASALAMALRVPQIIVGLTVVAYGTSTPEVVVGIQSSIAGHGDVALGNVIGSNIANVGLILGISALIRPAVVDGTLRRRELPVLLISTAVVPLLALDGAIGRWEGAALLVVACGYTTWMVRAARAAAVVASASAETAVAMDVADAAGAPKPLGVPRAVITAIVGLAVLLLGGRWFVDGAVAVAQTLGMSERLVGLTIVAVGTSLPELVTSVIAARRGHSDIAIGNVVGSNIFNVFLCLGASAACRPIAASARAFAFDLGALVVMTAMIAVFIRSHRTITRLEGAVALVAYAAFMVAVVLRG